MINRFFSGFGFVFEGKSLISKVPKIKRWIIFPFLIDIALVVVGIYFGVDLIQGLVNKATFFVFGGSEGTLYNFMYYPLLLLFWVTFVILYFYLVYILASVIASPFYSIIAEKTLIHLNAISPTNRSFTETVIFSFRMFGVSLIRGLVLLCLGLFLFVSSFIPGVNLLTGFAVFVIIALDTMDYSLEAKGFGFRQRLEMFRKNLPEFIGMGSFVGLTVLLPGLILLVMPFAVVGSAAKLNQMIERKKLNENRN